MALLSEQSPDPDLVDEIARQVLGFARPDERVLVTGDLQRLPLAVARP